MYLRDLLLTALAPMIWGSTYLVTTLWLPPDRPLTVALIRALPAGLLLLAVVRRLPFRAWAGNRRHRVRPGRAGNARARAPGGACAWPCAGQRPASGSDGRLAWCSPMASESPPGA